MSINIVIFEREGSLAQQVVLLEVTSEKELEVVLADIPLGNAIVKVDTKVLFPAHCVETSSLIFHSLYMKDMVRWDSKSGFDYRFMEKGNFSLPCLSFNTKWKSARIQHKLLYTGELKRIKKRS